jgi:hypothetical protein
LLQIRSVADSPKGARVYFVHHWVIKHWVVVVAWTYVYLADALRYNLLILMMALTG